MGKLIMSLLFLSNILDPFQALDDSGRPLPEAVLTFWRSGTTQPAAVYADQDLSVQLSDAQGRVIADSAGLFPLIYMRDDVLYRVRLQTARGVLRWDVDPYLCDCTEPPRIFRNPVHQALARISDDPPVFAAPSQAGARLRFTLTESESPRDVYADAARTIPLPNPLRANAAGIFPPVYLDGSTTYRVRLETSDGDELLEVDPYECQCGFLLITSRPYPLELIEGTSAAVVGVAQSPATAFTEGMENSVALFSGTLVTPLVTYDCAPEGIEMGASLIAGTLALPIVDYDSPTEGLAEGVELAAGTLVSPLVTYSNYDTEGVTVGASLHAGTLT